jgi:hypothetical protein
MKHLQKAAKIEGRWINQVLIETAVMVQRALLTVLGVHILTFRFIKRTSGL